MKSYLKFLVFSVFSAACAASLTLPASAAAPAVPSGYEMVDAISNTTFEDAGSALGFAPDYPQDGAVSRVTTNPISGAASLKVDLNAYGRVSLLKDYPWDGGPLADSVTFAAKIRVDAASAPGKTLEACAFAYFQDASPRSTCQDYPVNPSGPVDVFLTTDTDGMRLDYVFPRFKLDDDGTISATVDDAHLYVVQSSTAAPAPTPAPAPTTTCTADTWSCTSYGACSAAGTQTRSCTMTSDCAGVSTPSPATSQSCTSPAATSPSSAAYYPSGTLIKRGDQPAVYYLAADGKRYVFPNERTFHTWYVDFSGVRIVTASEMAAIPIGGNVTYRPGSRMIKIETDPKVYAVSRGGVLRPIASESVAAALYGSAWANAIDDIPDAFFTNYAMGAAVNSSADYRVQDELNAAPNINADKDLGGSSVPPASCTADTWSCTDWNACPASGSQTRSCTMTSDCAGVSTPSPATSQSCTPPGSTPPPSAGSVYPGYTYSLPANRPYISFRDFSATAPGYASFKSFVDAAVAGAPGYGYTPADAVVMYALTGQTSYIDSAIRDVDAMVAAAETDIAAGRNPDLAGDSYLEVGHFIEQVAFAYDRGYDRLTPSQRTRWAALAERAVSNIWDPEHASWGGRSAPWSGWSIDDPGNNYFYSFIKATQLWALASKDTAWISFLQSNKWPQLVDYYAQIPGGGSREGTGYGTAHKNLFEDYRMWKASTGEDLSKLSAHAKDTIDFWVHATVPTLDRFAPIGDQSRVSHPDLYDYQENLVREAVVLNPGTEAARRGMWWLANNSVTSLSGFNRRPSLMTTSDVATAPTALEYHSSGTGDFFARSSWASDATWMAFRAGPYDQSHAHQDQGSFTFFKNGWLTVTDNIWSHSGIHQETGNHNVLRFVKGGSDIGQNESVSSMTYVRNGAAIDISANLTPAYSRSATDVRSWTRDVHYEGDTLRVHDVCQVGAGVTPIFQVQVPVQPATQPDGSMKAGNLKIVPGAGTTVRFVSMNGVDSDFNSGWRVEITKSTCDFNVEMTAL